MKKEKNQNKIGGMERYTNKNKLKRTIQIECMAVFALLIAKDISAARSRINRAGSNLSNLIDYEKSGLRASGKTNIVNVNSGRGNNPKNIRCSKPGDPKCIGGAKDTFFHCGKNAKRNSAGNGCECTDPRNYSLNPKNQYECIKNSELTNGSGYDPKIKKACGKALIKVAENACELSPFNNGMSKEIEIESGVSSKIKCYDPADMFIKLKTNDLMVDTENEDSNKRFRKYDEICANYTEELLKNITETYSITGANSITCKVNRAIAAASNDCYKTTLSVGRAYNAVEKIEGKLKELCGRQGITKQWNAMFGNDHTAQVQHLFPDDIPDRYRQTGKLGAAEGMQLVGNFLDGKITDKKLDWEAQITALANSYNNTVSSACGKEYEIAQYNTNLQIAEKKSSLARMIDEEGGVKGTQKYFMNQISVFTGENRTNKWKREGFIGGIKDKNVENNNETSISIINLSENEFNKEQFEKKIEIKPGTTRYLVHTDKSYAILKVVKDTNTTITQEKYNKDMNLSNDALKTIIGKTEANNF